MKTLLALSAAVLMSLQALSAHAGVGDQVVAERQLVDALSGIRADAERSLRDAPLAERVAAIEADAAAAVAVSRTESASSPTL